MCRGLKVCVHMQNDLNLPYVLLQLFSSFFFSFENLGQPPRTSLAEEHPRPLYPGKLKWADWEGNENQLRVRDDRPVIVLQKVPNAHLALASADAFRAKLIVSARLQSISWALGDQDTPSCTL